MPTIEQSIEVNAPVRTVYNQWTQFEQFPEFMEGVESVTQLDDTHLRWIAEIAGKKREWKAEISEQRPDERVAWHAVEGKPNSGVVTFHRIDDSTTKIMVQMEWEPEGAVETAGAAVGADDARVRGDLERFKELIESQGRESGGWRGEVEQGERVG